MGKITKTNIVDSIYEKTDIQYKGDIRFLLDMFLDEIKGALVSNNTVELRGFGTFEVRIRKGRDKARNPKTGETFSVEPHGIAAFRPGKHLKHDVWKIKDKSGK